MHLLYFVLFSKHLYNLCLYLYSEVSKSNNCVLLVSLAHVTHYILFQNDDPNVTYKVEVSYIEIYNEKVRDLLSPSGYVTSRAVSSLLYWANACI